MICFSFRAFRFTRKGYAASVRQQSCQALDGQALLTFPFGCRGGFNIRPRHLPRPPVRLILRHFRYIRPRLPPGGKLARGARLMRGRATQVRRQAAPHPSFATQMPPSPQGEGFLRFRCGKLAAITRQRVTRGKRSKSKCGFASRLFTAPSDAGAQFFAGWVRRKVDGAVDARRTDSHDPRIHEQAGRLFVPAVFF